MKRDNACRVKALSMLAVALAAGAARAADIYVAPGGSGTGTDWSNPLGSVQVAVDAAGSGDTIYLRHGVYSNMATLNISNKPAFTLSGGWAGSGPLPGGDSTNLPSVLTRNTANNIRIVYGYASTATFQKVTVAGGYLLNSLGTQYGAGLYLTNSDFTFNDCSIGNNVIYKNTDNAAGYGAGIYANNGAVRIVGGTLSSNRYQYFSGNHSYGYGGALCANNATVTVSNAVFSGNYVYPYGDGEHSFGCGGAAYLAGGNAQFVGCAFSNNYAYGYGVGAALGGAIYAENLGTLALVSNVFVGNYAYGEVHPTRGTPPVNGGVLYVTGPTSRTWIGDCRLANSFSTAAGVLQAAAVYLSGTATVANCFIQRSGGGGLTVAGGVTTVTNGLMALNGSDGVTVAGGSVSLVNVTMADNLGWGLKRTGGTAAVTNGIAWGNVLGGLSNATAVSYADSQETQPGPGNTNVNPRFVYGYYLSVNGLQGQTVDNTLTNAGSDTVVNLGLSGLTTRTDGGSDTGQVDLGYHYAAGLTAGTMSNLTLYVDAVSGNDGNAGWAAGTNNALKTLTAAFGKALDGSTINVATGRYSTGETYPLVVPVGNLTLNGANAATTAIYGDGANRLLTAVAAGHIQIQGLTFQNGSQIANSAAYGAGLFVQYCDMSVSNSVLVGNVVGSSSDYSYGYGGGVYALGGRLSLDSVTVVSNRVIKSSGNHPWVFGGGIYADTVTLICRNGTTFNANYVSASGNGEDGWGRGGALYMNGGLGQITGCAFSNNYVYAKYSTDAAGYAQGGAIYAANVSPFALLSSTCSFNCAYADAGAFAHTPKGGAIFLDGTNGASRIVGCRIVGNTAAQTYVDGGVWLNAGTLGMTNDLIAANAGSGLIVSNGVATAVNCTLADNSGWGLTNVSGVVTARNCIVWNNALGGFRHVTTTTYSDVQGGILPGTGNGSGDPLFVGGGDYHEQSVAGSWRNGTWLPLDAANSLCIDAGSSSDPVGDEPAPNGGRINMGAYGGTSEASKTDPDAAALPRVANGGSGNRSDTAADVVGTLATNGNATATVYLYWSTVDGANNAAAWLAGGGSVSNLGAKADGASFTNTLPGLTPNTTYFWNHSAGNPAGTVWATPIGTPSPSFKTYGPAGVDNDGGATNLGPTFAMLRGALTNGVDANVYFRWGDAQGALTNTLDVGVRDEGLFASNLTGLARGTVYYYRACASNRYGGEVMAAAVTNFTTLPYVWITAGSTLVESQTNLYNGVPVVVEGSNAVLTLSNSATYGSVPVYRFGNLIATNGASVVGLSQGGMTPYTVTNRGVAIQSEGDVIIAGGSSINADAKGFAPYNGPGGGSAGQGGTHGGIGDGNPKATYGSFANPVALGSGGGDGYGTGFGGGALKLIVPGNLIVNGRLSANGAYGRSAGGAGGSIWITGGGTLGGTGEVQVSGGAREYTESGGAGGRLSIDDTVTNYNFRGNIRGANGHSGWLGMYGVPGTVYFGAPLRQSFTIYSNQTVVVGSDVENVFGSLTIHGTLIPGGDRTGAGTCVVIRADSILVGASGKISADGWGLHNAGPGWMSGVGGTHAGVGQGNTNAPYGSALTPTSMGSGGGNPCGGGAVKLIVTGQLNVLGSISANAESGHYGAGAGGSIWIDCDSVAGPGGIHANGTQSDNGPEASGGGRIAVYYRDRLSSFNGLPKEGLYANADTNVSASITVRGGYNLGVSGPEDGSIYVERIRVSGTLLVVE